MQVDRWIERGYRISAVANVLGVLIFSQLLTNTRPAEVQPEVFSTPSLVLIMTWGLAYWATARAQATHAGIGLVFGLEKLIYVSLWLVWLTTSPTSLQELFEADPMTGMFFAIYGPNDALFGAIFFYSAWRAHQNTRGSHPSIP